MKMIDEILEEINATKVGEILLLILYKLCTILVVLLVAKLIVCFSTKLIKSFMNKNRKEKNDNLKKIASFETMIISIIKYSVYIIAILSIFTNVLGVLDIKSVLATVGVGGVAIGFGAQSLIKDVISGFFILLENQMNIGDYVIIGETSGTVKELDLRCVKLETYPGEIIFLPYGEIKEVKNMSKTNSSVIVDIPVKYGQNIDKVKDILNTLCEEYTDNNLIDKLEALDPVKLDSNSYILRIFGKVKPCSHWEIERNVRRLVLMKCEENNIKLGEEFRVNADK